MAIVYNTTGESRKVWGRVQKSVGEYVRFKASKLVYHLYNQGYTYQQVGDILGYSRQAVEQNWPKGEHDSPDAE